MLKPITSNKIVFVCTLCTILFAAPLFAAEGPYPPRGIKGLFELDLFTQVVSRRVVEEINPGEDFEGDAVSTRVMARLGVKPVKPLELYIQGGGANLDIDDFDYRGDFGFAYGGGLNLTLYEGPGINRFRLKAFGDALTFTTDDRVLVAFETTPGVFEDVPVKEEIKWVEYAAGITGRWRVSNWDPYVGVRFSWLESTDDIKDPRAGELDLEEDDNIGIMGGTDIYLDPKENIAVNLEATLIDQASFKIGLKLWY